MHTGKVNSIDNQRVINQNPKITGNKPAILISSHSFLATATEMNNNLNMKRRPTNIIAPHITSFI
jgi:hypothetical protein